MRGHECDICSAHGIVTPATHELKYRRATKEEKKCPVYICEECLEQFDKGADALELPFRAEDYEKI